MSYAKTSYHIQQQQRVVKLEELQKNFNEEVIEYEEYERSVYVLLLRTRMTEMLQSKNITDYDINLISIDAKRFLQSIKKDKTSKNSISVKIFGFMLSLFGEEIRKIEDAKEEKPKCLNDISGCCDSSNAILKHIKTHNVCGNCKHFGEYEYEIPGAEDFTMKEIGCVLVRRRFRDGYGCHDFLESVS